MVRTQFAATLRTFGAWCLPDRTSPSVGPPAIRIAVIEAAVCGRAGPAARRRERRVAESRAAVGVPEEGAGAVPTHGMTETAR